MWFCRKAGKKSENMKRLAATLKEQSPESARLDQAIWTKI
jgi:hypothetical protein